MSAGTELQAAAVAALADVAKLGGVYDGLPVQAVVPYATVETGPETDWGHKNGAGREVRLAVTIRDEGERPSRLRRLMAEAEQSAKDWLWDLQESAKERYRSTLAAQTPLAN